MIKQLNDRQEVKLNMYRAMENHVNANIAIIQPIKAFNTTYNKITANIAAIIAEAEQKTVLTGHTEAKKAAKLKLSNLVATVAGLVSSYAAVEDDKPLQHEMDVQPSKLERIRDDELIPQAQLIHDRAEAHIADLADYNLTAANLTALQTAIDDYAAGTQTQRTALSGRTTATANLNDLFDETDNLLETQFDKQIESLRAEHPNFVNTYFATRKIIDVAEKEKEEEPEEKNDETPK